MATARAAWVALSAVWSAALFAPGVVSCRSRAATERGGSSEPGGPRGAPRVEVTFTRPEAGSSPGVGPLDLAIRDAIERLLYAAEDVPDATDVYVAAYDWDQFWNAGPGVRRTTGGEPTTGWPDPVCGKTFCCDRAPDCSPKGHACGGPGCGPANAAPYCKASWDAIDALLGRGLELEAVFNRGKSKEPVRNWLASRVAASQCRHFDPADLDRWCGVRTCGRGMKGGCTPGGACLGDGNMHVKMVLFRKLSSDGGSSEYNAFLTSGNFDYDQLLRWNDAVIIRGDPALYAGLVAYYRAMWEGAVASERRYADSLQAPDGSIGPDGTIVGSHGIVTAYLFPRDEYDPRRLPKGKGPLDVDILWRLLDRVESGRVRIAMAWFSQDRPQLVDALSQLSRRGVNVQIIVDGNVGTDERGETFTVDAAVTEALAAAGVTVRVADVSIHHKMILVDGRYAGVDQRIVFTGSHNFTQPALRHNDEILLRVAECETPPCTGAVAASGPPNTGALRNNDAFERYADQWGALCRRSVRYGTGDAASSDCEP